jgi:hypothetical protein
MRDVRRIEKETVSDLIFVSERACFVYVVV